MAALPPGGTKESFLEAVRSELDKSVAARLYELNETNPGAWSYFGIRGGGAAYLHPDGQPKSPFSILVKNGNLSGRRTWDTYTDIKYDEGFAELADFLGQDHRSTPKKFVLSEFDTDELWAVICRCAVAINNPDRNSAETAFLASLPPGSSLLVRRRSAENVWLEVQHRPREWMATGAPIYTLKQNVQNLITNVSDRKIE